MSSKISSERKGSMEKQKLILGLCDDEEAIHRSLERKFDEYKETKVYEIELQHFYSAKELLNFRGEMDALLLDIDMPQMDGIEAAHYMNKRGISYKIIMLTSKTHRYKEAFQIGAFRFVSKPIEEEELFQAIDDVWERSLGKKAVTLYSNRRPTTVCQRDIYYIMADGTQTVVFMKHTSCRSEKSLEQWEQELEREMFLRTHRSYIVNLGKIESIGKEITLVSGEKILMSKRKRKEVESAYMEYDIRYR